MNRRRVVVLALATPLIALAPVQAWAYYAFGSSSVTGTVTAASLGAPSVSGSQAILGGATIKVTAAPSSGPTPSSYRVDRVSPSPAQGVCTISAVNNSCNDSGASALSSNTYAVYSLLGTNWVSSSHGSVTTTVLPDTYSITSSASATAGTSFQLTIIANLGGITPLVPDLTLNGPQAITITGASNSPGGDAPSLPTTATFNAGVATITGTLKDAGTTTLSTKVGTSSAGPTSVTVGAAAASKLAWTTSSATGGTLSSTCYYTCSLPSLGGNGGTFTSKVSVTDAFGNIVDNAGGTVTLTSNPATGPTLTPTSLTIPSTGAATSSATFSYKSETGSWSSDTVTASLGSYSTAAATLSK
jgi:hypothetical protein